jgi:hypothetical protein
MSLEKVSLEEAIRLGFGEPTLVLTTNKPEEKKSKINPINGRKKNLPRRKNDHSTTKTS